MEVFLKIARIDVVRFRQGCRQVSSVTAQIVAVFFVDNARQVVILSPPTNRSRDLQVYCCLSAAEGQILQELLELFLFCYLKYLTSVVIYDRRTLYDCPLHTITVKSLGNVRHEQLPMPRHDDQKFKITGLKLLPYFRAQSYKESLIVFSILCKDWYLKSLETF